MIKNTSTVVRGLLPPGPAGTAATISIMRALARAGSRDPKVREATIGVIKRAGIAPNDYLGELNAVFTAVRDQIRYTRDPVKVEALQTPAYTLKIKTGDCDDKSTLLCSMLESIGHPSKLSYRVIGTKPGAGYSHVYVVANIGKKQIPLDPTPSTVPMGWQYPRPAIMKDFHL